MSIFTKRSKRIVAGSLAGALALSVSPIIGLTGIASAADALPPLADPIGAGNFCENAPTTEPFTDVSATDPGIDEIICLVATELTKGVTPTTYEPNSSITRRQMALFIKRAADLADELDLGTNIAPLPAYDGVPDFLDVAGETAEAKEAIGQLVQADIVQGTTATTYSPGAPVSRRQMAAFINRLQDFLTGDPFTTTGDFFNDDNGDTGEANLNAVASVGIFQGDGAGNVAPGGNLTRRQMAFVLLRHLQVNFEDGLISGPFQPATNATLTSDAPAGVQVSELDTNGDGTETVTFSGLDPTKDYDVALFPVNYGGGYEDSVQQLSNGFWMFRDQDSPFDGEADDECNTSDGYAYIDEINGDSVGGDCEYDVEALDGELVITLLNGSTDEADSFFLVVWVDNGTDDDELDLNAADTPTEAFGVAGPFVFTDGECASGTDVYGDILYIDHAEGWLVADNSDCIANYDAADEYRYDFEKTITFAQWDDFVNNGDYIDTYDFVNDVDYTRTGSNDWMLENDYTGTPTNVVATANSDDVTVTWDHDPTWADMGDDANGDAGYCIQLRDATDASQDYTQCSTFDDGTPEDDAVINNMTYTFENVAAETYYATVYAISASDDDGDYSDPSNQVTSPVANSPVAGAPVTIAGTGAIHTDGDGNGYVSAGDTLVFTFNEPIADPAADAQVTLTDGADGTVGLLINGTNASFSKSGANRILVLVTAPGPIIVAPGTTPNLQYVGLTVLDPSGAETTGIKDLDEGLEWNVAGSADVNP